MKIQTKKIIVPWVLFLNFFAVLTAQAAPPVLNATASVLTGVAPLGVFFDAVNTTSNVAADTFTDIEYEWDFGDPGSGTWPTTGGSKNSAFGALGFHVFENPGSYQVQLTARDAQGGTSTQNFTITVTDPNVVFSGANTICFSPTDFVGCSAGALQVTTNQWLDLQPYVATGKRLLLRRGATFGVAWTLDINANGPGVINAFGSGAKPIVQSNNDITLLYGPIQNPPSDWRIGGLDLRGSYPATTNPGDGVQLGRHFLFHDNDIRGVNFAVYMGPTKSHQYIVGNNILNNKGYGAYLDSSGADSYAVVMGNNLSTDGSGGAHLIRTYISKGLFSHNHFNAIGFGQHQLKFCGTSGSAQPAQKSIISSNHFNDPARPGSWMISIGPENQTSLQKVQDVIFERNLVQSVAQNAMIGVQSRGADRVTVRNNIFKNIGYAVSAGQPVPGFSTWNNWRVLNNSYLNLTTPDAALINSDVPMPGIVIKNNVVAMPNSSASNAVYAANLLQTSKSNITESHNVWHFPLLPPTHNVFHVQEGWFTHSSWANQTCANGAPCGQSALTNDPMYVNSASGNLQLQTGSTALDSGTPIPQVLSDYTGQLRHATNPDRGAFELSVPGGGGGSSGPQCNDGVDNDGDGLIDWQYDLGCSGPADGSEAGTTYGPGSDGRLENGWSTFNPSADTRIVYVSASQGNDAFTGLCPDAPASGNCGPKQTIAAAYSEIRNGYPDWLLLRRGDTWTGQGFTPWMKSGRSATERIVIASYGNSTVRPRIVTDSGFYTVHNIPVNHMALMDLNFVRMTVAGTGSSGIFVLGDGQNFLMENLKVEQFSGNLGTQANAVGSLSNFAIRRCIVVDAYTTSTDHSEGSYLSGVDGLLLEETLWDHNGWSETIPQATPPTVFRRNIYGQHDLRNVVVKNIISARSASEGIQMRSGGTLENSLFLKNTGNVFGCGMAGYPGNCSASNPPRSGIVRRNVFLDSRDIVPVSEPRGGGMDFDVAQAVVSENIFAHGTDPATYNVMAINIGNVDISLTLDRNVVYNWYRPGDPGIALTIGQNQPVSVTNNTLQTNNNGVLVNLGFSGAPSALSLSGNRYFSQNPAPFNWGNSYSQWVNFTGETGSTFGSAGFPEPTRSIETYMQSLGQTPTLDAFLTQARLQSRWNWRSEYTAGAVNNYIRAGFGIGPYVPVNYAPTVNAGPNQTITAPVDTVTLAGNVTDDGLPNPPGQTTANWARISGPGNVTFGNASSLSTTATFSQPGTYVLRLTASDSALGASDDVQIVVNAESGSGSGGGANNNRIITETRIVPCSNPQDSAERSRIPVCFDVKESGNVSITIYSRQGKKVRELLNGHRDAGENRMDWDLKDDAGNPISSGPYNVLFEGNGVKQKTKVVVIR